MHSSAASFLLSAILGSTRHAVLDEGLLQTLPAQPASCHGTRIEKCRTGKRRAPVITMELPHWLYAETYYTRAFAGINASEFNPLVLYESTSQICILAFGCRLPKQPTASQRSRGDRQPALHRGGANLFLQLVNARCGKGSMIMISIWDFAKWDDIFVGPVVATELVDQLHHHADLIRIEVPSQRLRNHTDLISERIRATTPITPRSPKGMRVPQGMRVPSTLELAHRQTQ